MVTTGLLVLLIATQQVAVSQSAPIPPSGPVQRFVTFLKSITPKEGDICKVCREVLDIFGIIMDSTLGEDVVKKIAVAICEREKMEDDKVCKDAVNEWSKEVIWTAQQLIANPNEACPLILEDCGSPEYGTNPYYNWTIPLPNTNKPPNEKLVRPPPGSKTLRILHLSDPHIDHQYLIGSEADCLDPLCCRKDSVPKVPGNISRPAGKWGDFSKCDTPYWTVDTLMDYVSKHDKFDYIYMTGDLPSHHVWNQTPENQLMVLANFTAMVRKYFPNTTVLSAVGNHESAPVDSYPPHWPQLPAELSIDWLYKGLNSSWRNWLTDPKTTDQIMKRGSYSQKVADGLRLISINTNYNDDSNFYILLNQTDPDGVLQWLMDELQDAENAGDKVHIIAHEAPSGGGKFWSWNWVYYNIVNRYENTIRGQFFGHTHHDEWRLFFKDANPSTRATGWLSIGISIVPGGKNAGWKVYTVDARPNGTWAVLDWEAWTFDLNKANANPNAPLIPKLEYKASEAYGLKSCFPDDMYNLVAKMETPAGQHYLEQYGVLYTGSYDKTCDQNCMNGHHCEIKTARPKDPNLCKIPLHQP